MKRIFWKIKSILLPFKGSQKYWEERYAVGWNSGMGSYNKFAQFKAEVINQFVIDHNVESVIEFGCGDGQQLALFRFRKYLGFDVSPTAIQLCRKKFNNDETKKFSLTEEYAGETADLSLSLDVIYHLVEDETFNKYMKTLFSASNHFVIIYSSNVNEGEKFHLGSHIRHRKFMDWVDTYLPEWKLIQYIPNRYPKRWILRGSHADFFIYQKEK
jgi:SAM-dependent methyltransferase